MKRPTEADASEEDGQGESSAAILGRADFRYEGLREEYVVLLVDMLMEVCLEFRQAVEHDTVRATGAKARSRERRPLGLPTKKDVWDSARGKARGSWFVGASGAHPTGNRKPGYIPIGAVIRSHRSIITRIA